MDLEYVYLPGSGIIEQAGLQQTNQSWKSKCTELAAEKMVRETANNACIGNNQNTATAVCSDIRKTDKLSMARFRSQRPLSDSYLPGGNLHYYLILICTEPGSTICGLRLASHRIYKSPPAHSIVKFRNKLRRQLLQVSPLTIVLAQSASIHTTFFPHFSYYPSTLTSIASWIATLVGIESF